MNQPYKNMDQLKMQSKDQANLNYQKLVELFPNAVTETVDESGEIVRAIDKDILMQEISSQVVEGRKERYQFTWPDKRKAILAANEQTTNVLRPCREESEDYENTENLYIEGDNLEVLKVLRETYLGSIKMIYIDPPYNTGNDFVYNDNFTTSTEEENLRSGLYDEEGNYLYDPRINSNTNGRFHTDWLNMMYPRLKVARDLLTKDGVIFMSIDENEVENLKKISNEIFGESNFVDTLHWKKKKQPSFLAKHTAKVMEYVLVYAKDFSSLEKLSIEKLSDATKKVVNLTNPISTRHFESGVRVKLGESGVIKAGKYKIRTMEVEYLSDVTYSNGITTVPVDVSARFSVSQDKIKQYIKENLLFITANYGLRRDVSEEESNKRKAITDLLLSEYGDNQESDNEFKELFDEKYFDYTKPVALIYNLINSNFTENQIVLDFFSGSATTAHAVMKLNADDGGNRHFIMVQLPEKTNEDSEAYKAGYKNICELGKERIRRAGKLIKKEYINESTNLDTGFRVLKLDSSNMQQTWYTPNEYVTKDLFETTIDNIKPGRTEEDLLYQVMLELDCPLSSKIEERYIKDKKVFVVSDGYIIACFGNKITNDIISEIAKLTPMYFVMRDSSMANDSVAVNFEQIFKSYSPETQLKVF